MKLRLGIKILFQFLSKQVASPHDCREMREKLTLRYPRGWKDRSENCLFCKSITVFGPESGILSILVSAMHLTVTNWRYWSKLWMWKTIRVKMKMKWLSPWLWGNNGVTVAKPWQWISQKKQFITLWKQVDTVVREGFSGKNKNKK